MSEIQIVYRSRMPETIGYSSIDNYELGNEYLSYNATTTDGNTTEAQVKLSDVIRIYINKKNVYETTWKKDVYKSRAVDNYY